MGAGPQRSSGSSRPTGPGLTRATWPGPAPRRWWGTSWSGWGPTRGRQTRTGGRSTSSAPSVWSTSRSTPRWRSCRRTLSTSASGQTSNTNWSWTWRKTQWEMTTGHNYWSIVPIIWTQMCKRVWPYVYIFLSYHLGNCDDQCNANKLTVHSTCYLLQKEFGFDDHRKKWSTLAGIIWSCAVNFCPQYNPQPSFSGPKDQVFLFSSTFKIQSLETESVFKLEGGISFRPE